MYSKEQRLEELLVQAMVYLSDYETELQELSLVRAWCQDEADDVRALVECIKTELATEESS